MKTKEISGYVQTIAVKAFKDGDFHDLAFFREIPNLPSSEFQKAKMIIEAKEAQVTITESQFDEKVKNCLGYLIGNGCLNELKEEFFGSEG